MEETANMIGDSPAPETQTFFPLKVEGDPRDHNVLMSLEDYMTRHGLTTSAGDRKVLANRIGTNETYIAKYLTKDNPGKKINFPLAAFEEKVRHFIEAELVMEVRNGELVETDFIVKPVAAFLRHVKSHGHIGIGYGDAGRGKTCAARIYSQVIDRTSIYVHVHVWEGSRQALVKRIARAAGVKGPVSRLNEILVTRLAGSERLLILDNAHRLTEHTRRWLVDFWEASRTPIALIGNPEIEQQFRSNDQHGSRIGLHRDVTIALKDTAEASARHMLRIHFPEGDGQRDIIREAVAVLGGFGSCRTLEMRAKLAAKIIKGGAIQSPREAFEAAKTQLIAA